MAATSGCSMMAFAGSASPWTMLTIPGNAASRQSSPMMWAVASVSGAGLRTTAFPAAMAGAIFHNGMQTGKFHGVISPTTPNGRQLVMAQVLRISPERSYQSFFDNRLPQTRHIGLFFDLSFGFGQNLSFFERECFSQAIRILLQQLDQSIQNRTTLGSCDGRPFGLSGFGGRNGIVCRLTPLTGALPRCWLVSAGHRLSARSFASTHSPPMRFIHWMFIGKCPRETHSMRIEATCFSSSCKTIGAFDVRGHSVRHFLCLCVLIACEQR